MRTLFYDRPRTLVLLVLFLIAAGFAALASQPRLEDPSLTTRNASVFTPWPGATPERVEAQVTEPLERAIREVPEVKTVESSSRTGLSNIAITLDAGVSSEAAADSVWTRVRDRISDARTELPPGVGATELDNDLFPAFTVITALRWQRDGPPNLAILSRYAEELQTSLRNVGSTDLVRIFGAAEEEIVVEVATERLAAAGMHVADVAQALDAADPKAAAGALHGRERDTLLDVGGEFDTVGRIASVPLNQGAASSLQVGDVAQVVRGHETPPDDMAIIGGERAVVVATRMAQTAQVGPWVEHVQTELDAFRDRLPAGVKLDVLFDQSTYAEQRFGGLLTNLGLGVAIVVVVLVSTLGWRAALTVAFALPLTSLGALFVINLMGESLNQMSVTGLIVALGLVVDASIVMVDAVRRKLREGMTARAAVADSVTHFWAPLLASTVTTMLAFMPIALMPGAAGEFVGGIAFSVMAALAVSYLVALTVTASVAGLVPGPLTDGGGWLQNGVRLPAVRRGFEAMLDAVLAHPRKAIAVCFVLPATGLWAAGQLDVAFFPPADRNQINVEVWLPDDAAITETRAVVDRMAADLKGVAGVEKADWFLGRSAPSNYYNVVMRQEGVPNYAQGQVYTVDAAAASELVPQLQRMFDRRVPRAQVLVQEVSQGPPFEAPLMLRVYGPNLDTLRDLGEQVRDVMAATGGVTHTRSILSGGSPKVNLNVDENSALAAGLRLSDVAARLQALQDGQRGGSVIEGPRELPVRVRVPDAARADLPNLMAQELAGAPGTGPLRGAPLQAVAEAELVPNATPITRRNGRRLVTVFGYIEGDALPQPVLDKVLANLDRADFTIPSGYDLELGGENAERGEATSNLAANVPMIVVLMVAATALTFNSFRLAGVLFVVALQAFGLGLLSVAVVGYNLGFIVIVALMGLVGLAINAAIIIMAAFRDDDHAAAGDRAAMRDVVVSKTSRHIVSTTVTTFGGFTPLILSSGAFWPPFAVAIAGGTLLTTVISFVFVPAVYAWLHPRPATRGVDPVDTAPTRTGTGGQRSDIESSSKAGLAT
jgi:multidrug efflux pump subunit AcrB